MACLFFHKWNGCKCVKCGATRAEGHRFKSAPGSCESKCEICGKVEINHTWDGCRCSRCGEIRDADHQWQFDEATLQEKCSVCGKTRKDPQFMEHVVQKILSVNVVNYGDSGWKELTAIGKAVNAYGGMEAMKRVCTAVMKADPNKGRNLESSWDGIGEWMG